MPLVSMTGYGRGVAAGGGLRVEVELSSVNRRQFDARIGLPRPLIALEARAHALVHDRIERGQVAGSVKITAVGGGRPAARAVVDETLAAEFAMRLGKLAARTGAAPALTAGDLAALPGVLSVEARLDEPREVWPLLRGALNEALDRLCEMRGREGRALEKDLVRRLGMLRRIAVRIGRRAPGVTGSYRRRLLQRLREAGVEAVGRDPQLVRELALFAERSDITEELVRLDSHFAQADKLIASARPAGRALDFLCQELFREINTIGSKACDTRISRNVIAFKAALETLREQVQNVE